MKTIPELLDEISGRYNRAQDSLLPINPLRKSASDIPRLIAAMRIALRGYGGDTTELAEIARILAGEEPMSDVPETSLAPFDQRAEQLIARAFRGINHVRNFKKIGPVWTCLHHGYFSTQDSDYMTRLVFAAHEYCCRAEVSGGGPYRLKIKVSNRDRSDSNMDGHKTIAQALEKWNSHSR